MTSTITEQIRNFLFSLGENKTILSFDILEEKLKKLNLLVKQSKKHPSLFLISIGQDTILSYTSVFNNITGVILEKDTYKIICISYERVFEFGECIDNSGPSGMEEHTSGPVNCDTWFDQNVSYVSVADEGTFIRLFFYKGEWIVSTLRCIDSSETYNPKSPKNFNDMFWETSGSLDVGKLDVSFTYCFILQHPDNRCIIPLNVPVLIYNGKINSITGEPYKYDCGTDIVKPSSNENWNFSPLYSKMNFDYWIYSLSNSDLTYKGFFFHLKDGRTCCLYKKEYMELEKLRGTNPCIKVRYLELNDEQKPLLINHYPDSDLQHISSEIKNVACNIHWWYMCVFVHKQNKLENSGRYKFLLQKLHREYIKTKKQIDKNQVYEKIMSFDPSTIGWLSGWY